MSGKIEQDSPNQDENSKKDIKHTKAYSLLKERGYENIHQRTLNNFCWALAELAGLRFQRDEKRKRTEAFAWLDDHFDSLQKYISRIVIKDKNGNFIGQHDFDPADCTIINESSSEEDKTNEKETENKKD